LIEGKAIPVMPWLQHLFSMLTLMETTMAVHVPLSHAAILEAQLLMLSSLTTFLTLRNGTPTPFRL